MYDKLVVAVDGSNTSLNALKHAANLAHMTNAKLVVVTIVNPTEFMAVAPEFLVDENYESAAIQQGEAVLDQAEKAAKEIGVKEVVRHMAMSNKGAREMAQLLVDFAENEKADLLVLGTHGRTGLMHLLMGSFAETVMRQSTLPLLILRGKGNEAPDFEGDD